MTDEQKAACKQLAKRFSNILDPVESNNVLCRHEFRGYLAGFEAAQSKDMLLLNPLVKALVDNISQCNETYHRLGGIDDCGPCSALFPFQQDEK